MLQQSNDKHGIEGITNKQSAILRKRNNAVSDQVNKTARYIINYCLENNIGTMIVGYNKGLKHRSNMGAKSNQNFVQIPVFKLADRLEELCSRYGVRFVRTEESYTSRSSFWDNDPIPVYKYGDNAKYKFSGVRRKHSYKISSGQIINADLNGALNIMRKSNIVPESSFGRLYARGPRVTPVRIKLK